MSRSYPRGLVELEAGLHAWLQPDGGWGWSNAGFISSADESLLVDTLFDEPLTVIDPHLKWKLRRKLKQIHEQFNITMVYVTHDQTEALTLGDRVTVLKKGVLQQCASPRELYDQPVNLFVAGFIGTPPMNFLPASVEGDELVLPFCRVPVPAAVRERAGSADLLIVGIRPEHIKDADLGDVPAGGVRFAAPVDQTEWLGNEQYAFVPFEATPEIKQQLAQFGLALRD